MHAYYFKAFLSPITYWLVKIVEMHAKPDISLVSYTHQKKISWNGITFQDDKKYKTLSSGS